MKSKIFVCFTGIDGSGKSTLAKMTYEKLSEQNNNVKLIYGRLVPLFSKLLMSIGKKTFLKKNNMYDDYDSYFDKKKTAFKKNPKLSIIYRKIIFLEYVVQMYFKIIVPQKFGKSIIADRYVFDTIINDLILENDSIEKEFDTQLKILFKYIPRPDIVFFVKVPEEVALSRKNDIPSINYLKIRNKIYSRLEQLDGVIVLDGTKGISDLNDEIFEIMKNI